MHDVDILSLTAVGLGHEEDKRRGIRWNFTTVLEYHDFADDIALQ